MKTSLPVRVCRAMVAFAICLGVLFAPAGVRVTCGSESAPAGCHCCAEPQSDCCAAESKAPAEHPALPAPTAQNGVRDMFASAAVAVAFPPVTVGAWSPDIFRESAERRTGTSRLAVLCIRMV
ncbi:MAG: hypothetical protein ABMA01_09025 [Chthoniobacteraceae bacterium]